MRSANPLLITEAIPYAARRFIMRRFAELGGLALVLAVILVCLALATWSTRDPSINHATSGPIYNMLGAPGAKLADLMTQIFGLASLALLAPVAMWGWRLITDHRLDRLRQRAGLWIVGALCAAGLASLLPATDRWPLPTGLGGMVGDMANVLPFKLTTSRAVHTIYGIMLAFAAVLTLAAAAGANHKTKEELAQELAREQAQERARTASAARRAARRSEEDEDDGPSRLLVTLGAAWHLALTTKAAALRGLQRLRAAKAARAAAPRVDAPAESAPKAERIEPGFAEAPRPAPHPLEPHALEGAGPTPSAAPQPRPAPQEANAPVSQTYADEAGYEAALEHGGPAPFQGAPQNEAAPQQKLTIGQQAPALRPAAARPLPKMAAAMAGQYALPALGLLSEPKKNAVKKLTADALGQNARILEGVLDDFGVKGEIINVRPGPVVTLYELEPAPGVKSSRVIGLADDIARSMSAISARVAVVQGRNAIGVELPNHDRETVYLRELLASADFETSKMRLAIALGKTIGGESVIVDLAKMPHLLVAGTTGSGKSVAINTMILSLLYRLKPSECRLIMVDPKMLELSVYDGIPHLLTPVVTDPKKAVVALKWAVREMEDRYKKMSKVGVRNIEGFNARVTEFAAAGQTFSRDVQKGFDKETGEPIFEREEMDLKPLPFIVVIVDEMADLMMVAGKDIEGAIQRLAQMARAAGIHLIMATQRPSVDVITGTIKANFPTRISFQVTSKIDSRTILGEQGAEQLLGQGDMLYMAGGGRISRVHGPFVSDHEVEKVVAHLKTQGAPEYLDAITVDEDEDAGEDGEGPGPGEFGEESGDLYDRAVNIVLRDRKCSTSYIQRRLSVGYNKAASLVERMEKEGVVGRANHAGKREILVGSPERDGLGRVIDHDDP